MDTQFVCDTRETRRFVNEVIEAGLVPFVQGPPGSAKSSIMRLVAADNALKVIDHRLSTSEPTDMTGLPRFREITLKNGKTTSVAEYAPFTEIFPIEGITETPDYKRDGYQGWMVFFDEFNSAGKAVQAASYKVILDKMIGQLNLHPYVAITAAGNQESDRAIVNELSTAMKSRLIHIRMKVVFEHWLKDVALTEYYDPRIIGFLSYKPDYLMDFNPESDQDTFCCPRTWEFMNRLVKNKPVDHNRTKLFAGTITSGAATEFVTFTEVYDKLPTIRAIRAEPDTMFLPADSATAYATVIHMLSHFDEREFETDTRYVNRLNAEHRVVYYRGLMVRQPQMRKHPQFAKSLLELQKYLHDDEQPSKVLSAA